MEERGPREDMAGLGRRVGVHGGDVQGEERLDIGILEFALSDGDRHGSELSQARAMRRGEGLTATFGTRTGFALGKSPP